MAYTVNRITYVKPTSDYGTATKAFVADLVSTIPGWTLGSVFTDTASDYNAAIIIAGSDKIKCQVYNAGMTVYFIVSNSYSSTSDSSVIRFNWSETYTVAIIQTQDFYIFTNPNGGAGIYGMCGWLHPQTGDGIEVIATSTSSWYIPSTTNITVTAALGTMIDSATTSQLPQNQFFLSEGLWKVGTYPYLDAPYLLNGHGIYGIAGSTSIGNAIISNGSESFYVVGSNAYALHL